jgi:multidrug efflux pump subunit AcrA (membrane-fusion protein)
VPDANVLLETPNGSVAAKPANDGTYRLAAPWAALAGRYDLIATVTKGSDADVLAFTLEIPPANPPATTSAAFGSALALGIRERISSSNAAALVALLGAFVLGGIAGLLARRRRAIPIVVAALIVPMFAGGVLAHEGEDHGTPQGTQPTGPRDVAQMLADGSVFVPKSTQRILAIRTIISEPSVFRRTVELPGRVIPDPNASGFVQAAVGGRLSPPDRGFPRLGTRVKRGDVLAYVTPPLQAIDISDMRQRQGELDQQISIVERRVTRFESLVPSGAISRVQLDETRLELQGLKDRRAALDRVKLEPEPLVAPVDGIVADGNPVAGQVAQTNAVVFHIIDPSKLWVEALSYESLPALQAAAARVGSKDLRLVFRGAGFADRNQSIPIHFAIEGDVSGVRVGQFVTVFAETPDEQNGLAVPRTSVVRTTSGQDAVYEHVAAERFEQRLVRIEPLDGQRVLISQGLSPGKRIVVQGAELIDHIR